MWKWITGNPAIALATAVLFIVAAASVAGFFHTRTLLKTAQSNLVEERKYLSEREAVNEGTTGKKDAEIEKRLVSVLLERDALKKRLAELEAQVPPAFVAPASDNEIVTRFQSLGYKVRVVR